MAPSGLPADRQARLEISWPMQILPIGNGVTPVASIELNRLQPISPSLPHAQPVQLPLHPPPADSALIDQIAQADMAKLTDLLEPRRSSEVAAHINDLTQDTTLALMQRDRERALENLNHIAALDPETLALLEPEKAFEPIRAEVDHLLTHFTTVAKLDAEGWLAHADQALETPGHAAALAHWQTTPETLLHVAHRLFDSGGYANYTHSADLAKAILNDFPPQYLPCAAQFTRPSVCETTTKLDASGEDKPRRKRLPAATAQTTWTSLRAAAAPRLLALWQRAPLLVLLLSWLGAGVVAGPAAIILRTLWPETWPASIIDFGFEVWGIGFLALVLFGFYARIRDIRSVVPANTRPVIEAAFQQKS